MRTGLAHQISRLFGATDPEAWVVSQAQALLTEARQTRPHVQLRALLEPRRIIGWRYDSAQPYLARLSVVPTGFLIFLQRRDSAGARFRHCVAHEIAHTFFYDISSSPPSRWASTTRDTMEERLCDLAAAELLVPAPMLASVLGEWTQEAAISRFPGLCTAFRVSPELMARRLCQDLGLCNALFVGCTLREEGRGRDCLRLDWFAKPRTCSAWVPGADRQNPAKSPKVRLSPEDQASLLANASAERMSPVTVGHVALGDVAQALEEGYGRGEGFQGWVCGRGPSETQSPFAQLDAPPPGDAARLPSVVICFPLPALTHDA